MAFKVVIIGQGKPPPPSSAQGDAQSGPQSSQNVSKTATGEDEEFSFSGIPIVQHEPTGTSILNRQPNPGGGSPIQPFAMFLALGVQFYVVDEGASR